MTASDLMTSRPARVTSEATLAEAWDLSTDVVAAEPETELSDLMTLLLEHKVGAIPVVTPDTRQIVGIVSYIDVLRVAQKVLEAE